MRAGTASLVVVLVVLGGLLTVCECSQEGRADECFGIYCNPPTYLVELGAENGTTVAGQGYIRTCQWTDNVSHWLSVIPISE